MSKETTDLTRRTFLQVVAGVGAALGLTKLAQANPSYEPTPEIPDDDEPTPAQIEGPFFKPKSPERRSIGKDVKGTPLVVQGRVLTTAGVPIAGALLDFWHCDAKGTYDNAGFKLRGHQYTDKDGKFLLETIVPGVYPGRTRHIHVKAQAPKGKPLSTQLYFPREEGNQSDSLYMSQLAMKVTEKESSKAAMFDFVLRA
jgi:protocatechuate 3,4-dioxygenase beta subunit